MGKETRRALAVAICVISGWGWILSHPSRSEETEDITTVGEVIFQLDGKGEYPDLRVIGYPETRRGKNKAILSEFSVCRGAGPIPGLTFSALQRCLVEKKQDRLIVTDLIHWPFGKNWAWEDRTFREYVVQLNPSKTIVERIVLQSPRVTTDQCHEVVSLCNLLAHPQSQRDRGIDSENIIGRLLVTAMGGCLDAVMKLLTLPENYRLDGVVGETYEEATHDYKMYRLSPHQRNIPADQDPSR